uniref:Seminal fluid protein HACP051 n=1 Tax=Heliconius melpomene TaxID=34740 RepID=D9HQ97_HELME|nr:seminal fluid protein HACP051 [Heliconius melpomene]
MKRKLNKISKCMLLLNLLFSIHMIAAQGNVATTLETIILETTTELVTIITDIPQSDVEIAVKHDVGKFTTMVFDYVNAQFSHREEFERCYDDYMKCLINQSIPIPVCTMQDPYYPDKVMTFKSYCDAYFDNCLRKKSKLLENLTLFTDLVIVLVYYMSIIVQLTVNLLTPNYKYLHLSSFN